MICGPRGKMASEEWREEEALEDRDFRVLMEYAHGFMVSQVWGFGGR